MANAVAHPCASYKWARSTHRRAKCAHFSHRHNALVDRTMIRMIVLRRWFEPGQISDPRHNEGDNGHDYDDDHHDGAHSRTRLRFRLRCWQCATSHVEALATQGGNMVEGEEDFPAPLVTGDIRPVPNVYSPNRTLRL
jgi:hypothetical protein